MAPSKLFFRLFVACLALRVFSLVSPDSAFVVLKDSSRTCIPWDLPNGSDSSTITVSKAGALHGAFGIFENIRQGSYAFRDIKTGFFPEPWFRFYLRLDYADTVSPPETALLSFLRCSVSEKLQKQSDAFFSFGLRKSEKSKFELILNISHSGSPAKNNTLSVPVFPRTRYCVEARLHFKAGETAGVDLYVDGVPMGTVSTRYYYPCQFYAFTLFSDVSPFSVWRLSLDEFILSDSRMSAIPARPIGCGSAGSGATLELFCQSAPTTYKDERLKWVEWRLFLPDNPEFPLLSSVEEAGEPDFRKPLPFELDSGLYLWQCRFKNNFNAWSDWSDKNHLWIKEAPLKKVRIIKSFISRAGSLSPDTVIFPETWYDLHLKVKTTLPWNSLGYALALLNDTTSLLGNPGNKGGVFQESSGYVANLSLMNHDAWLFEKAGQGTLKSRRIPTDSEGVYLDNRKGAVLLDTVKGDIRIRFRLLKGANEGKWLCSSWIVYPDGRDQFNTVKENISNISRIQLSVQGKSGNKTPSLVTLLSVLLVVVTVIAFLLVLGRKKRRTRSSDLEANGAPELSSVAVTEDTLTQRFFEYLEDHFKEKITVESLLEGLKISRRSFYDLMSRQDKALPVLVNQIRIKHAKKLIKEDKSKTMAEIGLATGFQQPHHFAAVFKEIEGVTPKEYRDSNISK